MGGTSDLGRRERSNGDARARGAPNTGDRDGYGGYQSVGRKIADLGADVENEGLLEEEFHQPYQPYGPDSQPDWSGRDFMRLAGDAELTKLRLNENASVAGITISEAAEAGYLSDDVLVVAIERKGNMVTPKGDVEFRHDDIVDLLFKSGFSREIVEHFGEDPIRQ